MDIFPLTGESSWSEYRGEQSFHLKWLKSHGVRGQQLRLPPEAPQSYSSPCKVLKDILTVDHKSSSPAS